MERLFVVRSNGETEKHIVSRGLYTNQASSDTSAYQALYGRISVNGDKFIIHPDSLVTLDTFHGPDDRSVWRSFGGYPADSTQHQIRGDDLHLEYYTYPADAPVLTRTVLYRIR